VSKVSTGLSDVAIQAMQSVFARHDVIVQAILYGSRAMGTYREGSDIDLTLKGSLDHAELLKIELELDDLMLPYNIDLSLHHQIDNPELLDHIDRVGLCFYERAKAR
jgi:uncharacterized protein